ncbi:hypothetical protein BIV60_27865 [Bacillus sp. MUM 116]|nr:hypothetical protein BIV60_27865 [Bacillus sp. MUM 116]
MNQKDAEFLITFFPKIVKATRNHEQLEKRNLLIGYLLYTMGLRASELLSLNWGSFRYNRIVGFYLQMLSEKEISRDQSLLEMKPKIYYLVIGKAWANQLRLTCKMQIPFFSLYIIKNVPI